MCRLCLQRSTTYHRKQVRGIGKSAALGADERCLDSNLDYYREGWDNKLRSLFGMQDRPRRIMFAHSECAILP